MDEDKEKDEKEDKGEEERDEDHLRQRKGDPYFVTSYWDKWRKKKYRRKPRSVISKTTGKPRGYMPHNKYLQWMYDKGIMYPELAKKWVEMKFRKAEEHADKDLPDDFDKRAYEAEKEFDRIRPELTNAEIAELELEHEQESPTEKKEREIRAVLKRIKEKEKYNG